MQAVYIYSTMKEYFVVLLSSRIRNLIGDGLFDFFRLSTQSHKYS